MKYFLPAFLTLVLLTGCARHYRITLNNNHVITTTNKPKLNKTGDAFIFKDATGRLTVLPVGTIKQIEPQSHTPPPEPLYKPK